MRNVEFRTGISVLVFYDDSAGFISDQDLSKFREFIKGRDGVSYESYPLNDLGDKKILLVSTNEDYGYNLFLIRQWLLPYDPKDIFMPDRYAPAFIKLKDGHNFIIAPFDLNDGIDRGEGAIATLKKPQKSLSSFW